MSPLQWAFRPFRKFADFKGRAPRAEYWWYILVWGVLFTTAQTIDWATGTSPRFLEPGWATWGLCLILLLPSLAVSVRRLHDVDRSGWQLLWYVVPFVGWVIVLMQFLTSGTYGANSYGPDPLSSRGQFSL